MPNLLALSRLFMKWKWPNKWWSYRSLVIVWCFTFIQNRPLSPEKLWLLVVIVRFRSHHDHMNYNFFTFQSFPPCKNTKGSFCVWGYLFSCFPTPNCWMLSPLQSWGRWVRSGGPPVPLILDRPPQYWNSPHGPLPPPTPTHPHPLFPRYFAFPPKPM